MPTTPASDDITDPEQDATQTPDLRGELFQAQRWCADLVAHVGDDHLSDATPCTDFDVRRLIAHIAMVFEKIEAFGRLHRDPRFGEELTAADYERIGRELEARYVDDLSPAERSRELEELIDEATPLWTVELLDEPIQLGWGPVLPGRAVAAIYLMETVAHGWDLASATGQNTEAPAGVAQAALAAAKRGLPESPRGMEHGVPFGPVVASAPDAGPTTQMANWTGRRWPLG